MQIQVFFCKVSIRLYRVQSQGPPSCPNYLELHILTFYISVPWLPFGTPMSKKQRNFPSCRSNQDASFPQSITISNTVNIWACLKIRGTLKTTKSTVSAKIWGSPNFETHPHWFAVPSMAKHTGLKKGAIQGIAGKNSNWPRILCPAHEKQLLCSGDVFRYKSVTHVTSHPDSPDSTQISSFF